MTRPKVGDPCQGCQRALRAIPASTPQQRQRLTCGDPKCAWQKKRDYYNTNHVPVFPGPQPRRAPAPRPVVVDRPPAISSVYNVSSCLSCRRRLLNHGDRKLGVLDHCELCGRAVSALARELEAAVARPRTDLAYA